MAKEDLERIQKDLDGADAYVEESDNYLKRAGDRAGNCNDNDGVQKVEHVRKQGNEYRESIKKLKKDFGDKGR